MARIGDSLPGDISTDHSVGFTGNPIPERRPMNEPAGPRFPPVVMEQLNDAQKRVAERVLKVSSAGLGGPYAILLRSPILLERYLGMTDYLRFETSLPKRLNELAILIEARL
jgi:hypothetical protein